MWPFDAIMRIEARQKRILALLATIVRKGDTMSATVDSLVAEVASLRTVSDSAVALLAKLFGLLQGAIDTGDMTKVQAALDDLRAQEASLAAAITANTPPAPPTPPTP